jgi:hypothetical protein
MPKRVIVAGVGVKVPVRVKFGAVRVWQQCERGGIGVAANIFANRISARCGQWKKA